MSIGLEHFLALSAALFCVGLFGALSKRNAIVILMCIELMMNGANIALVAFARFVTPALITGQIFAVFVLAIAAAEAAVGLAIIIAIYRNHRTISVDDINLMKW